MASDLDYDSESDVDLDYEDYTVAWIAPLEIEKQAALGMLDKRHKGKFTTHRGDDYLYAAGEIKGHNVVIATFPAGHDYGNSSAAALASQVKNNFPNLWFGLLVGVAAGLPNLSSKPPRDIRLGDVLVGVGDRDSAGVVCYDLGRETPTGFKPLRRGDQPKTLPIVSSAIGQIKNPAQTNKNVFLKYYKSIKDQSTFVDPGQEKDRLYQTVKDGNGSATRLVERRFRSPSERTTVWYGPIGSGNKLMRDAQTRDRLRDQHNLIGLEMEGASILNIIPVGVIRGVCDYGDSQKDKIWQPYAAAMAAAYAKALLSEIKPYKTRRVGVLPAPKVLSVRKASKVPKGSVLNMERDKDMEDESEAGSEEEDEEEASVKKRFEEIKHNLRNDKINLRDTDEFEKFAEQNKDYLGKTTAAADGHNTLLHLLVDDAKDRVFDKYKPLFKLLIDSYPELPEIKDISDRTPLYISISKKREMLVRFMCDTHPNIDVILGISCLRTDYCLHVAIKKNVNPDLTIFLIEHAGEWALCAQDDMGKTPLHLAVEYERCTDAQLQVVKALIRRCDKAMNKRTIEPNCFSPYRYHEYTRAEAKKAAEAEAKKAAKQKKKEKESEDAKITERSTDAIMNFLKLHCMHTMKHDDAVNFLYGRNQEKQIYFNLCDCLSLTITEEHIAYSFAHLKFEDILQYVAFPSMKLEEKPIPHSRLLKKPVKSLNSNGRSDMVFLFDFLRKKGVKHIIRVIVDDKLKPAHSDEAIERALGGLRVETWDWQKSDLCAETIFLAAPDVTKVYLYWSGNNAVLSGWSEQGGLKCLGKLEKVHLHVEQGLETAKRNRENVAKFCNRLKLLCPNVEVEADFEHQSGKHELMGGPVDAAGEQAAHHHKWLMCMDEFADFIQNVKPPCDLYEPVTVALIDDGVDMKEQSLHGKVIGGMSFSPRDEVQNLNKPYYVTSGGHGTVMASLICRVCPKAQLYILKLEEHMSPNSMRQITAKSAAKAVRAAIDKKVHIISMSWTIEKKAENETGISELEFAIQDAARAGILMFCAANDQGIARDKTFPAGGREKNLFKIGAATDDGMVWKWMGELNDVDFIFPGHNVVKERYTEVPLLESCKTLTGSSVATAIAAGLAALVLYCVQLGALDNEGLNYQWGQRGSVVTMEDFNALKGHERMMEAFKAMGTSPASGNRYVEVWHVFGSAKDKDRRITDIVERLKTTKTI